MPELKKKKRNKDRENKICSRFEDFENKLCRYLQENEIQFSTKFHFEPNISLLITIFHFPPELLSLKGVFMPLKSVLCIQ